MQATLAGDCEHHYQDLHWVQIQLTMCDSSQQRIRNCSQGPWDVRSCDQCAEMSGECRAHQRQSGSGRKMGNIIALPPTNGPASSWTIYVPSCIRLVTCTGLVCQCSKVHWDVGNRTLPWGLSCCLHPLACVVQRLSQCHPHPPRFCALLRSSPSGLWTGSSFRTIRCLGTSP